MRTSFARMAAVVPARRRSGRVAAGAVALSMVLATPALALVPGLPLPQLPLVPGTPAPDPGPDPVDELAGVTEEVCDTLLGSEKTGSGVLGDLAALIGEVVDPVSEQCDLEILKALNITFLTRLRTPDGPIVRKTSSFPNVPTPINVDADDAPDLIAQVQVLSFERFELRIIRAPGETSALPASVEALVTPPGDLPRDHVNFGYDATGSRAPTSFVATGLIGDQAKARGVETVALDHAITGAGPRLAILGGLYDGSPTQRTEPIAGRLTLAPVPTAGGVDLTAEEDDVFVRLRNNLPTRASAAVSIKEDAERTVALANLDKAPGVVEVDYEKSPDEQDIDLRASEAIDDLGFVLREYKGDDLREQVRLGAKKVPTEVRIDFGHRPGGARDLSYRTFGGKVAEVDLEFLSRDKVRERSPREWSRIRRTALEAESVPDDIALSFTEDAEADKRRITYLASSRLPRLRVDFEELRDGDLRTSAFVEANGVPTGVTVNQSGPKSGSVATVGGSLDNVEFGLADGAVQTLPGDEPYLRTLSQTQFGATPSSLITVNSIAGRVKALKSIGIDATDAIDVDAKFAFTTTPIVLPGQPGLSPQRRPGIPATPLRVLAEKRGVLTLDNLKVEGRLEVLPRRLGITIDPDARTVSYDSSAGIRSIDVALERKRPFFKDVKRISAEVRDVPEKVAVAFEELEGDGVRLASTEEIGYADLTLNAFPTQIPGAQDFFLAFIPGSGEQGVAISNVGEFRAFARVYRLKRFEFRGTPLRLSAEAGRGSSFRALTRLRPEVGDPLTDQLRADVRIDALPASIDIDETKDKRFEYSASAPIEEIRAKLLGLPGDEERGEPRNVIAGIRNIPTAFTMDLGSNPATGDLLFDAPAAAANPAGGVDLQLRLWDREGDPSLLPNPKTSDYVMLEAGPKTANGGKEDGRRLLLRSELDDVQRLRVRPEGVRRVVQLNHTAKPSNGFRASLFVRPDESPLPPSLDLDAFVPSMPRDFRLEFATEPATLDSSLRMSEGIPRLELDLASVPSVVVDTVIRDIPSKLNLCMDRRTGTCGFKIFGPTSAVDPPFDADRVFGDPLGSLALNLNTLGTATKGIRLSGTICGGKTVQGRESIDPGSIGSAGFVCRSGSDGVQLDVDDLRVRDVRFALGGGNLCSSGGELIENNLFGIALDTAAAGLRVNRMDVFTSSTGTDCDDDDAGADRKRFLIKAPDAVTANEYATIIDATNKVATDVFLGGTINCPNSFLVEQEGIAADLGFNFATFLTGCNAG